jgi:NADH-quinone oxidoreductase subunit F
MKKTAAKKKYRVRIGLGSCGIAAGAAAVLDAFTKEMGKRKVSAGIGATGCLGICHREVLVEVVSPDGSFFLYGEVTPQRVPEIVGSHLVNGVPVAKWLVADSRKTLNALPYCATQKKIVLGNCGSIDPEDITDYVARGGYEALRSVLRDSSPPKVIECISVSNLRGRGGAGFPTGTKWKTTLDAPGIEKYVICNADEGDPGAFMDRSVLESDPHSVLEGMAIAGYAIGASNGVIYVRAEYPVAVKRLSIALEQAEQRGFLGKNVCGLGFDFSISIMEGAGAFVCGEETALIKSIEGERGMPRLRPPFPSARGLWGKPTCVNNVETLANVPWIIRNGADAYAAIGTKGSKGTKVFARAGKIARGGLVEVPMGATIREIVEGIGGGSATGLPLKAVQIGGPSGGCLPARLFDTPIDYESLRDSGAIMGSGGLIVLDESSCMVDIARYFLAFTQNESCGKCTFCRIGTKRMLEILDRITKGMGRVDDLDLIEELSEKVKIASLCGLGQTAPNPVLTTLRFFRDEYMAHIKEKRCPAGKCKALINYRVDEARCTGCGACVRICPAGAVAGERGKAHRIDTVKCTRCGLCVDVCKFEAIEVT